MKATTLPGMVEAIKRMGIVPGSLPDNVCLLVELDEEEFEKLLDQVYLGKSLMAKKTSKIKGYLDCEISDIKFKIERK